MKEFFAQIIFPSPIIVIGIIILVALDLIWGVRKAAKNGEATTSRGLRKTFDKAGSYFTLLISVMVVTNVVNLSDAQHQYSDWMAYLNNGIPLMFCYVEMKSILENLIEINTHDGEPNELAATILIPIHDKLILKFKQK